MALLANADALDHSVHAELKAEFQSELQNTRIMGVYRMQERVAGQTINAAPAGRRVLSASSAIAANHVITRAPWVRWIVDAKLGVIENIEPLRTEFKVSLSENLEVLQ